MYEHFETQKEILIVTELAAGGDLLTYLRKRRCVKEDAAKSIFIQLIQGLIYCHGRGVLHRDIKLDNLLLTPQGDIKICDFGIAKMNANERITD